MSDSTADLERIRFGTDGWRDRVEEFTDERLVALTGAVVTHLEATGRTDDPVAVGFDARESSPQIATTIAETFERAGHDVWLAERDCPTPAVAAAVEEHDLAAGVMVTASHNPPEYNGIKVIPAGGAPALPDVTDFLERNLREPPRRNRIGHGNIAPFDFVDYHVGTILDRVDVDVSGMTIAYDAMHGSGRGVTDVVLERAGAEVIRLRCDRAPQFGGVPPEPDADRLADLVELVDGDDVDLGVATDGDADRVAIVTPEGFVDANLLFAAMYEHLLEERSGSAVRTVSTTFLIDRVAADHDESVIETAVGFKWVADAMREHDALIGGEDSGGFSVRGHVPEKDGPFAGALVADAHRRRSLDTRIADLFDRHGEIHRARVDLSCPEPAKQRVLNRFAADRPETVEGVAVASMNDADGLKLLLEDGTWVLCRPSGTEPLMRVYAEATDADRAVELAQTVASRLEPLLDAD